MTNTNEYGSLMVDRYRLDTMPHAQCHVCICRDKYGCVHEIDLISYETLVCVLTRDIGNMFNLWCTGTYSPTTRRHINRFTTEFCGQNYYPECRDAIGKNLYDADYGYFVTDIPCFAIEAQADHYKECCKPYYGFGNY